MANATNTKHAVALASLETNKTTFRADNEANKVRRRLGVEVGVGEGVWVCGIGLIYQALSAAAGVVALHCTDKPHGLLSR